MIPWDVSPIVAPLQMISQSLELLATVPGARKLPYREKTTNSAFLEKDELGERR
jgi:hypothetical protein